MGGGGGGGTGAAHLLRPRALRALRAPSFARARFEALGVWVAMANSAAVLRLAAVLNMLEQTSKFSMTPPLHHSLHSPNPKPSIIRYYMA